MAHVLSAVFTFGVYLKSVCRQDIIQSKSEIAVLYNIKKRDAIHVLHLSSLMIEVGTRFERV